MNQIPKLTISTATIAPTHRGMPAIGNTHHHTDTTRVIPLRDSRFSDDFINALTSLLLVS
ncbi:hypothetical protein [Phormidesmis priestleyi]|uniref:hypothetical protein n=1 Tax=Phormidesmis priestleyi TaxID=268141 RepID=UPI0011B296C8|nr:hypothetical protein [Phormidesmis priestleyi]